MVVAQRTTRSAVFERSVATMTLPIDGASPLIMLLPRIEVFLQAASYQNHQRGQRRLGDSRSGFDPVHETGCYAEAGSRIAPNIRVDSTRGEDQDALPRALLSVGMATSLYPRAVMAVSDRHEPVQS